MLMITNPESSHTPYMPGGGSESLSQTQEATLTERGMARQAINDLFSALAYSPNNPNYLTSLAFTEPYDWLLENAPTIESNLVASIDTISMDNADFDLWQLSLIRERGISHVNQYVRDKDNVIQVVSTSDRYTKSAFLKAGIEEPLRRANEIDRHTPTELITEATIDSVGAMLLRGAYFQKLSQDHPEEFTPEERDEFLRAFQHNIISAIRHAAILLHARKNRPNAPVPVPPASELASTAM